MKFYILKKIKEVNTKQIISTIINRKRYIILISLCMLLLIGYFVGGELNSKSKTLVKLEDALTNYDIEELSDIATVNGKKVDKDLYKPLIEYYKEDTRKIESTINDLNTNLETNDIELKSYNFLFWKRYKINIKTYNIKMKSNFSEGEFKIDNYQTVTTDGEFGNVIAGVYNIIGTLKSEYGDAHNSTEILLMDDTEVNLDFNANYVVVNSEFTDAEIFINQTNTNFTVRDEKKLGPIIADGTVKMHLEKDFPWGRIKGEEVATSDTKTIKLDINILNDKLKADIKEITSNYYQGVFNALNKEDKSLIDSSTEQAQDKIYSILEKDYVILKNKYNIKEININEDKNEYSYKNGEFRATIVIDVSYDISKALFGINKTESSKSFFTKLLYKDGKWVVEDVENFSL